VTATAPLSYNSSTQTVALTIGSGLAVAGGALTASGSAGSSVRLANVSSYNVSTRVATVSFTDDSSTGSATNKTNTQLYANDAVTVATTTSGTNAVVSVVTSTIASSTYYQQVVANGYPKSESPVTTTTNPVAVSTTWSAVINNSGCGYVGEDINNVLGLGAGRLLSVNGYDVRAYDPANWNTYTSYVGTATGPAAGAWAFNGAIIRLEHANNTTGSSTQKLQYWNGGNWTVLASAINGIPSIVGTRMWWAPNGATQTIKYVDEGSWTVNSAGTTASNINRFVATEYGQWALTSTSWMYRPNNTTSGWTTVALNTAPGIMQPSISSDGSLWFLDPSFNLVKITTGGTPTTTTYIGVFPSTIATGFPTTLGTVMLRYNDTTFLVGGTVDGSAIGGTASTRYGALWAVTPTGSTRVWTSSVGAGPGDMGKVVGIRQSTGNDYLFWETGNTTSTYARVHKITITGL